MGTILLISRVFLSLLNPSVSEPERVFAKLFVGMAQAELFVAFGDPESSSQLFLSSGAHRQFFFRGKMCQWQGQLCSVLVKSGRVVSSLDVKPSLTEGDL